MPSRFSRQSLILGAMEQPILGQADAGPDPVVEAYKQHVDRSLIREGRFDLHVRLDLPNEDERARIFEAQLAKRPSKHFDLQPFAKSRQMINAGLVGEIGLAARGARSSRRLGRPFSAGPS